MSTGTYERFMNELHKPMSIRLRLTDKDGDDRHAVTISVAGEDDFDDVVSSSLIGLLRHTWYLAPGDVIRIEEV